MGAYTNLLALLIIPVFFAISEVQGRPERRQLCLEYSARFTEFAKTHNIRISEPIDLGESAVCSIPFSSSDGRYGSIIVSHAGRIRADWDQIIQRAKEKQNWKDTDPKFREGYRQSTIFEDKLITAHSLVMDDERKYYLNIVTYNISLQEGHSEIICAEEPFYLTGTEKPLPLNNELFQFLTGL